MQLAAFKLAAINRHKKSIIGEEGDCMNTHSDKIKIVCAENCGNSPKKELLRDLTIAFAKNEMDYCIDCVTDDIVWDIIGQKTIRGKSDFEKALNQMKDRAVQEIHIQNIITHGNTGSVNGALTLSDKQLVAFCNVYNFRGFGKNSKIRTITSYIININTS